MVFHMVKPHGRPIQNAQRSLAGEFALHLLREAFVLEEVTRETSEGLTKKGSRASEIDR